jgi:hypothetical protein
VRITAPHYFDFGEDRQLVGDDLVRPEAWDAIRTETAGPFGLPPTRAEWESVVDSQTDYAERATVIDRLVAERGDGSIASYGVGVASLELWLHRRRPGRPLLLGEYAPATTARLRELFPEAEVHQHDLLVDAPLAADWHVFHRIDTEFTNRQWRGVLERFAEVPIVFAPGGMTDLREAISEVWTGIRNRNATRSGFVRNRPAFESLWRSTHDAEPVEIHDLQGWVLLPSSGR